MSAFFIVGVQRSGTTMLSSILAQHPDILMENKVNAFRLTGMLQNMYDLLPHNQDLTQQDFIEWIVANDQNDRLENIVTKGMEEEDYRSLIKRSLTEKLENTNAKVWGDKAPNLQHYISDLQMLLPDAKFIHIVRDGRAAAASMSKRSYRHLKLSAQMWVDGNSVGMVNQRILGKAKYLMVKYEDIISQPENSLKSICEFLSLPFHAEILDLSTAVKDGKSYVKDHFDLSKIDAWKTQLSKKEIDKIEEIQASTLNALGYEVGEVKSKSLSLSKKLWLMQVDNWRNLFRRRKVGMKDKMLIKYDDSFRARFRRFVHFYGNLFLSEEIRRSIFSRYFYKEKTRSKTARKP